MGGRGKTPIVRHIARLLVNAGERPAILSRGYGRRVVEDGVVVVSDGAHILADLDRAGDEPLMLARSVPGAIVAVCDERAIAKALVDRALGATVCVLDDGFQHRAVAREIDLVTITPDDLLGRALPFGALREAPSALARATAVLVDGNAAGVPATLARTPVFAFRRLLGTPVPLAPAGPAPAPGDAVVAVAGIAQPQRFADALTAAGYRVARLCGFRDHHQFTRADVRTIGEALEATGAGAVVTTEKDAIRLLPLRPLDVSVFAMPLELSFSGAETFDGWLLARLGASRR
jgi:tetraacyldisaccharide 4'-kinase